MKPSNAASWRPPASWPRITTIDAHTAGEPFRVIVDGFPAPEGSNVLERRRHAQRHLDRWRTGLMWEPRGHADMYGCVLVPPHSEEADFGILFLHNEGYSTMCGHGIIGVVTVAVETGMLPRQQPVTPVSIDTPAGLVRARARVDEGRVSSVSFHNVPSFVVELDARVEVPGLGELRYDLAFGGAFYAYVKAEDAGIRCGPDDARKLIERGIAIKRAVNAQRDIAHPYEPDLGFLYGVVFTAAAEAADAHSRNACIFADGELDRSPTGTSVSARLAIEHTRGNLAPNETMIVESILGTRFAGRVVEELRYGPHRAIVPEVEGSAYITGRHEFVFAPDDPLSTGFLIR